MWPTFGDVANGVVILGSIAFAYLVVFERETSIFDPLWKTDGFCVSNKDVPYWNSHDLCLYVDTVLAVVLGVLYYILHKTPGMEIANDYTFFNIPAILAHGLGHGGIGKAIRDASVPLE